MLSLALSAIRVFMADHDGRPPEALLMSPRALRAIRDEIGDTAQRFGFPYATSLNGVDLASHPLIEDDGNMVPISVRT